MAIQTQPIDKTVRANGINSHYLEWGSPNDPPVILLHGFRGHAHSWDDVSAVLCNRRRVLALDQRGRGDSDWAPDGDYSMGAYAEDVKAFADALGIGKFEIIGHSMGGRNSMEFVSRFPEKVEKLVLVDIGPVSDPKGLARIQREVEEAPEEFESFEAVMEYARPQNKHSSEETMQRRMRYATKQLPAGPDGAPGKTVWRYDVAIRDNRRRGGSAPDVDLWPKLAAMSCPTLIVRGEESDILSPEVAARMVKDMPNARCIEVPKSGHMVFEDNPDAFNAILAEFLT